MSWIESLDEKLTSLANAEFDYIETNDIQQAANIGTDNSGIYLEATVIYFEIKNIVYILKENGRRKAAQAYTMYSEVLSAVAQQTGGFLNSFSPNAFLIVYPGKDNSIKDAVTGALKVVYALTDKYKHQFSSINGLEFAMGLDHGHIMGTKTLSDHGIETMSWFGTSM